MESSASIPPSATHPEEPSIRVLPRLSWTSTIAYAMGEVPITITMVLGGLFTLFFYNSVMRLPGALVGIGVSAGLVVDALLDPYIGFRSDTSSHRFGRRHVFMLLGALAIGPTFFLLFSPPRSLSNTGLFVWLLFFSVSFRAVSAVYRIPYLSLGAELTDDYHGRTRVIAIRALFGLLGMLIAASLSLLLFFSNRADGSDPKLDYAGYPRMGAFFGLMMAGTALWATFGTRQFANVHRVGAESVHSLREFFRGFSVAFRNPSFRRLWLSATLFFMAVVVNANLAVHYFTWYARISDAKAISGVQTAFYVGALSGVFVWLRLSTWMEKRSLYFTGMVGTAFVLIGASAFVGAGRLFGTGNAGILIFGHALAGVFASCLWVIPASMMADVADEDQLHTGARREGVFFGILNFGEKLGAGLAVLISGVALNYFAHLKPGQADQSSLTVERIGLLYGLLPGVLSIVAALLIAGFPLTERTVRAIQEKLQSSQK